MIIPNHQPVIKNQEIDGFSPVTIFAAVYKFPFIDDFHGILRFPHHCLRKRVPMGGKFAVHGGFMESEGFKKYIPDQKHKSIGSKKMVTHKLFLVLDKEYVFFDLEYFLLIQGRRRQEGSRSWRGDWGVRSASPQGQMTIFSFIGNATCTNTHTHIYIYIF